MLYLGWFNYGAGCLTAPREVFYDPQLQKLRALPVMELASLRQEVLGTRQSVPVTAAKPIAIFDDAKTSLSFDLEVEISLPGTRARSGVGDGISIAFGLAIMAATSTDAEVFLDVIVSETVYHGNGNSNGNGNGFRTVNISTGVPHTTPKQATLNASFSFQLPEGEADHIALRVLADRTIVEVFVGEGRGVITTGVLSPGAQDLTHNKAFLYTKEETSSVQIKSATAWAMGCGWARYP
jgi:sucrose-6-phosphate hydrolase SacC (GH32 family)